MWGALPAYLGGKRRLCPIIFRELDRILPRKAWPGLTFYDAFLGGGSVSLYAKAQGLRVESTDIAERAIVVGQALIENQRVRLTQQDVLKLAAPHDGPPGPIEAKFCPSVFAPNQARFLDCALKVASESPDRTKGALYRLLAVRVALLAHPMSQVRPGTIHRLETGEYESITESCLYHYVDGLRLTRPTELWDLAQRINAGVFQGEGRVRKAGVMDALPEISAAVLYADPPYPNVTGYEREYKVIDEILEGSPLRESPFSKRNGAKLLDSVFERALHIPIWVLSLGNAVVGVEELQSKMARFGRTTRATEIRYVHKESVASEERKQANREFLVMGWDLEAVERLVARKATHGPIGGHFDNLSPALVHEDQGSGRSEPPASKPSVRDGQKESKTSFAEQSGTDPRHSFPVGDRGVDNPYAVLKASRALDRKRSSA